MAVPANFPFAHGDRAAVRVLGPGDEVWFAGTLTSIGSDGLVVTSFDEAVRMWLPWGLAIVRSLADSEWTGDSA